MANYLFVLIAGISIFCIAAALGFLYFNEPSAATAPAGPRDRRSRHRFAIRGEAILSWQTDREGAESTHTSLIDIDEGGASVKSPLALDEGTYVYIEIPHLQSATTANVRYCAEVGRRWVLGLEFRGPLFSKITGHPQSVQFTQ